MSKNQFFAAAFSLAFVAGAAHAQSEASTLADLSMLPIASATALPAVLASAGAVYVVQGVEASAYSSVYTLERVSDGARVAIEISGRAVRQTPVVAGATVTATVLNTGVVLTVGSTAIAFVPNALGRALMQTERITA